MIDRMFIQEEKTMLALDKQLAKEKPGGRRITASVCPPFITVCLGLLMFSSSSEARHDLSVPCDAQGGTASPCSTGVGRDLGEKLLKIRLSVACCRLYSPPPTPLC